MSDQELFNISQVCESLIGEFPDLTVSKIRYLDSQGLLNPVRTEAGYRKFSTADLEQLVWILRQQRDYFVPLGTLKERLESNAIDLKSTTESNSKDTKAADSKAPLVSGISLDIEGLSRASGLPTEKIQELIELGVVKGRQVGSKEIFEGDSLLTIKSAKRLFELGMETRHLRMYLVAAQREAGVIEQLFSAKTKSGDVESRSEAKRELDEVVTLGREIHKCLLKLSLDGLETW